MNHFSIWNIFKEIQKHLYYVSIQYTVRTHSSVVLLIVDFNINTN
jgi:hypothetical protein